MSSEKTIQPKRQRSAKKGASLKVKLFALGFAILLGLVVAEVCARIAVGLNLATVRNVEVDDYDLKLEFVGDISEVTGVWHFPNAKVEVETPTGPVTYETNSHGMRDRSRERESTETNRVVVLGDSFAEGWMVPAADRFTDLLEESSGREFLNFGCSGSFGTIQEWLLYRETVKEFSHSEVALFVLPDNDFNDNNPKRNSKKRYRPYLRRDDGGNFEVYYTEKFAPSTTRRVELSSGKKFRHRLYRVSYLCNLLSKLSFDRPGESAYVGFSEVDWERMEYSLTQLAKEVGPERRLTVFVIPRYNDLHAEVDVSAGPTIAEKLEEWGKKGSSEKVRVVDLKPGFEAWLEEDGNELGSLFIPSDGHWNKLGHKVASEIIAPYFSLEAASGGGR